jgi:hypothetical protein
VADTIFLGTKYEALLEMLLPSKYYTSFSQTRRRTGHHYLEEERSLDDLYNPCRAKKLQK